MVIQLLFKQRQSLLDTCWQIVTKCVAGYVGNWPDTAAAIAGFTADSVHGKCLA